MKKVYIFTDGACSGNPGPGGWGALLRYNQHVREISGHKHNTTNNQMELMAVIEALKLLKEKCEIELTTDSVYVKNGITEWIYNWRRNNWRTANKKPVKNKELWVELYELTLKHKINWHWVKGHAGHPENEKCDQLAREEIKKIV